VFGKVDTFGRIIGVIAEDASDEGVSAGGEGGAGEVAAGDESTKGAPGGSSGAGA
jgi:hypothetical protein